jgi:hypothetical protein
LQARAAWHIRNFMTELTRMLSVIEKGNPLRFFAGLSTPEAAAALGVSVATAERW